jgi:hypothetical protein
MFIGIDWAKDAHEVCAVDASGTIRRPGDTPGRPGGGCAAHTAHGSGQVTASKHRSQVTAMAPSSVGVV